MDGKPVRGFEVAGEDRVFAVAQAVIVGTDILVGSPAVAQPVAVRYAFARNPDGNLGNGALLPAAPFRTDRWRDATAARFSAACSFESEAIGELSRFEHEIGRFEAKAGHAEITAQYARTGRQCLHLFGGGELAGPRQEPPSFPGGLGIRTAAQSRENPLRVRFRARSTGHPEVARRS